MSKDSRITDEKIDMMVTYQRELKEVATKMVSLYEMMNDAERALAGGMVMSFHSPWAGEANDVDAYVGNRYFIVHLLDRLVQKFMGKQSLRPEPPQNTPPMPKGSGIVN